MEEGEDPGSSFSTYSLAREFYQNEADYSNSNDLSTYLPLDYRPLERMIKVGTRPKSGMEKIKEAAEIEENPNLDDVC
jgi:hypothetical protein